MILKDHVLDLPCYQHGRVPVVAFPIDESAKVLEHFVAGVVPLVVVIRQHDEVDQRNAYRVSNAGVLENTGYNGQQDHDVGGEVALVKALHAGVDCNQNLQGVHLAVHVVIVPLPACQAAWL